MNERPTIREQMDACRPDSDDLHLPEHAADLAELTAGVRENGPVRAQFELSQQVDRVVRGAMQEVSLPVGLEARLLAAVQAESAPIGNPVVLAPAAVNRRSFLKVAGGLTAAAALVLVGVLALNWFKPAEQPITKDQLASQVQDWLGNVDVKTMVQATKPTPAPGGVLGNVAASRTFSSRQGTITAYLVIRGKGVSATLLAIPTSRPFPVGASPYTKVSGMSGGWVVGAWQKDGVLYVIAVTDDSGARLDQFVPLPPVG
ncbi:MAG: twin-arginine translocation signal domain-containing protein [Pirellulaceae bacterium]